jgi:CRP-like cAMP-binding protein
VLSTSTKKQFYFFNPIIISVENEMIMKNSPLWGAIKLRKKDPDREILERLEAIPVFENIPPRGLELIKSLCHIRIYSEGEHIFRMGYPGVGMYIILEGSVEIYRQDRHLRQRFAVLEQGDFFGELALLDDMPRSASALSLGNSRMLGFFRPDLLGLLDRNPRIANQILLNMSRLIGRRLIATNDLLEKSHEYHEEPGVATTIDPD